MTLDQREAKAVAAELAAEAEAAGLVVRWLSTQWCHGGYGCFRVDLATPGPEWGTWMEATHESESSIRQAIVLYTRGRVTDHVLEGCRQNRDGTVSAICLCGATFRAHTYEVAKRGVWEHRAEEDEDVAL